VTKPSILHAPFDVGGQARGLSLAERELGLVSDVAVFGPQRWGYEYDIDLHAALPVPLPVRMARRGSFLLKALERYEIFHFNFGHTLLRLCGLGRVIDELPLLRRRGKTILVTYQGRDARDIPRSACHRRAAERSLRYADRVFYLNPDLGPLLPGARFLPYANLDPRSVAPAPPDGGAKEVVVAHAPTDRAIKGTQHVIGAVELLRSQGLPVRLELLEHLTRKQVLERVSGADVVVDQLLIGWYGGFAVEAMALAKPVVCFVDEDDNPFGERLPLVRADPATLPEALRELVLDPARRSTTGLASRRFVEEEHDPRKVARTVLQGIVELP